MFSKKRLSFTHTVTFKLTLLFVVLFALLLVAVFIPIDLTLRSIMLNRLDAKIITNLSNFSYYDSLFTRRPKDANGIILDNLLWTANIDNNANVLWLLLSQRRDIIVSSSTEQWKEALKKIIETIPEFPHELPKPVRPETFNHDGFSYVLTDGVKQIAALKTIPLPSKQSKFRTAFMKYPNNMIMIGSYSLTDIDQQMAKYRKVLAIAFGSVLLIGGGLGFYTTKRAMLGVQRVTRTAISIGQGDLSCRVDVGHQGREIQDMAVAFNDMLERIQSLIKELKEVTTNVAHDLRSPITRIRGAAETALQEKDSIESHQEANGQIIAECDRLISIINIMLDIAVMDSGAAPLPDTTVDITNIVKDACELFRPVAEDKNIHLHLSNKNESIIVRGSKEGLQRVVANILDNAIKFTDNGGKIDVAVTSTQTQASICIKDTGIGISQENQQRIFDRFFRSEASRSSEGNGLGLSLAQSIVKTHGGKITVESAINQGSLFTIILPKG